MKKKNWIYMIPIILVVIVLAVFLIYRNFFANQKEEIKEEEKIEEEITDVTLKNDLSTKIKYITLEGDGYVDSYLFRNGGIYGDVFHDFSDSLKLLIVLDYLDQEEKFVSLSNENLDNDLLQDYIKTSGINDIKQISGNDVKDAYKIYFGIDLKDFVPQEGCFGYLYDEKSNTYFKVPSTCSDSSSSVIYSYKNRYTFKDDEAYVYVNYGVGSFLEDSSIYNIYKDFDYEVLYRGNVTDIPYYEFQINESNYFDFSEYRFTFKKDNEDNYYFVSLGETR